MNNAIILESFLNYCDEMIITNESRGNTMQDINYQKIYEILDTVLPTKYKKVTFKAAYWEGSYQMHFWVDNGDGKRVSCFKLKDIIHSKLITVFTKIDKEISPVRASLKGDKKWSMMTFHFDSNGNFKSSYSYKDISDKQLHVFDTEE